MKKFFLVVLVCVVLLCSVFAQSEEPKDLILVLDTSSSMSDYNEEVSNYLIGPFLQEFLNLGDTFHLISFSDEPKLELSRRIRETGDAETIIARLLLMYPLVRYSDIPSAVDFAENYTAEIPGSRSKSVIFITDGKNNAAPGSASMSDDEIAALLSSGLSSRFAQIGADVTIISVPLRDDVPGGRASSIIPPVDQSSSVGTSSGESASRTDIPEMQGQSGTAENLTETHIPPTSSQQNDGNLGTIPGSPSGIGGSEQTGSPSGNDAIQNNTVPPTQVPGTSSSISQETNRGNSSSSTAAFFSNISWPYILLILLILAIIIGLIIFFMTRNLHKSPGKAVYEASNYNNRVPDENASKNAEMLASYAAGQRKGSGTQSPYSYKGGGTHEAPINGPLMLSLFVEDQNTAIGRRNIHNAKSGTTLTVGGGKSDFLMFLVPMPQHIAEVRFDGRNCTFFPKKPKHFPDIGSQSVPNCIGKTIRVLSEKNYELFIRVERFQDPLLQLNRLMNSINLPGLPED